MRQAILSSLAALLLAIGLPAVLLEPMDEPEPLVLVIEQPQRKEIVETTVTIRRGDEFLTLPVEEYLVGVVWSEMPMSFAGEALKAQAVAARTFTEKQMERGKHADCDLCADPSCCQAWSPEEGPGRELARQAVEDTAGEVLTYAGELIDAVFFSCSGGRTEDAVAVWGSEVPYLRSVESGGEEEASVYASTVTLTADALQRLLPEANLTGAPETWPGEPTRTAGGGVASLELGGYAYSGTELRARLGLRSTNFTVTAVEDGLCFRVLGYGHRAGLSQYGANAMAQSGSDYQEILAHYYTGTALTKWEATG